MVGVDAAETNRSQTPPSLAWKAMSTSNILSSWVAPDVDDDLPSQGRHKDGNTTTIGCVRQLVANPFSQANIAQAQSTFEMLIEDSVLYTGVMYVVDLRLKPSWNPCHKADLLTALL